MTNTVTDTALADSIDRTKDLLTCFAAALLDARDDVPSACKLKAVSAQLSVSMAHMFETMSLHACATFDVDPDEQDDAGRKPHAPNETVDDMASWLAGIAKDRTYGPIGPAMGVGDPWAEHRLGYRHLLGARA